MANQKVVGIFSTQQEAIKAIERLKRDGYVDEDISVLAKDADDVERIKEVTNTDVETSDAAEGAVGGAVAGGAIGGIGALLVSLGVIAIPGVGPFLAAGPIAAALTGAVAGGAVGGIVGALVDMGLSKEEAEGYNEYIERGDILVMVDEHADRNAYGNFYENNSVIRDRYDRSKFDANNPSGMGGGMTDPNYPNDINIPNDPNAVNDSSNLNDPNTVRNPNDPNRPL